MSTAEPKARPILFAGPMVRALRAGQKAVTRRVVRLPSWAVAGTEGVDAGVMTVDTANGCNADVPCPYGAIVWKARHQVQESYLFIRPDMKDLATKLAADMIKYMPPEKR